MYHIKYGNLIIYIKQGKIKIRKWETNCGLQSKIIIIRVEIVIIGWSIIKGKRIKFWKVRLLKWCHWKKIIQI